MTNDMDSQGDNGTERVYVYGQGFMTVLLPGRFILTEIDKTKNQQVNKKMYSFIERVVYWMY